MSKGERRSVRTPATKLAHLRKKMENAKHSVKRRKKK